MKWFALKDDGDIHPLGNHETFEEAEAMADTLKGGTIWLIDEETARDWVIQLGKGSV